MEKETANYVDSLQKKIKKIELQIEKLKGRKASYESKLLVPERSVKELQRRKRYYSKKKTLKTPQEKPKKKSFLDEIFGDDEQ